MNKLMALLLTISVLGLMACAQGEPTIPPAIQEAEEAAIEAAIDAADAAMDARSAEQDAIEAATEARAAVEELQATQDETGTAVNQAPVVRAWGCDQGWALARLNGQASDPDGPASLNHVWLSTPESGVLFEDPGLLDTFVCLEGTGVWTFELVATDGAPNGIATDQMTITVLP